MELIEFTEDEIQELYPFIRAHAPHTQLAESYVLNENPIDKAIVFGTIYRVLNSCKNYASTESLIKKLGCLLSDCHSVYNDIYLLIMKYKNLDNSIGKSRILEKIINTFNDIENKKKIDKLIDAFLVFGEKIELNRLSDYMGVDMENDHGQESMKELREMIEKEKI